MKVKTVIECDYCQEQVPCDNVMTPSLPDGWEVIKIVVSNSTGVAQRIEEIVICNHPLLSLGAIIATCLQGEEH